MNDTTRLYQLSTNLAQCLQEEWGRGNLLASTKYMAWARVAFAANLIFEITLFPLSILKVSFATFYALAKWDWKSDVFAKGKNQIMERTNRIILSALGIFTPTLSHKWRYVNFARYILAARITAITVYACARFLTK